MAISTIEQERNKYKKAWNHDDYRKYAPGEHLTVPFLLAVKPKKDQSIIDFGTGTGRSAFFFHGCGYDVKMVDIADNCLDPEVQEAIGDKLTVACLWDSNIPSGDIGYCTDVMEHIPPNEVDAVLQNIMAHCKKCFFNIHVTKDHFGEVLKETLHLTVRPFEWWRDKLQEYGTLTSAKDLIGSCTYILESRNVH